MSYRKIYKEHYGDIPLDQDGRSYEIHHIDGNHENNDPKNLKAVTIQEHYDIHYAQGDYGACLIMSQRMNISPEIKTQLASLSARKRIEEGDPHWGDKNPVYRQIEEGKNRFVLSNPVYEQLKRGMHVSQKPDSIQKMKNTLSEINKRPEVKERRKETTKQQVNNGTHNFLGGKIQRQMNQRRLKEGTHTTQQIWICEYCKVSGKGHANYKRWHGQNCKGKT